MTRHHPDPSHDDLPDVRDGLTRRERVVLHVLHEVERELNGRRVPVALLYGRVIEHENMTVEELQNLLARLAGATYGR